MRRRRAPARPRKTTRRWHIPPPLVHGPEPLEGGAVLEEIAGEAGVVLWQALRDVLLWVDAAPEERAGLFAPGAAERRRAPAWSAALDPVLAPPLQTLLEMVERPLEVEEASVAGACSAIAGWAEQREALSTGLAFAQNAALVAATQPDAAYAVARLAARRADHARAEVWFRRAIGIARQARDWRMYSRSFSGLGGLYQGRGNLPAAQRFHVRALRGARRGGLRAEQAAALHDLFGVAIEMGRAGEAERYARQAFDAYGGRSPRVAVLAHDVAYFWMEQGHFSRALAVFQAVLPLIERPVERMWVEADIVRAAAGSGDVALAHRMAEAVWEKCRRPELAAGAAKALLELGRGSLQLQDWEAAESAAEASLRLASDRREGRTRILAESLLDAVRASRSAARPAAGSAAAPRPAPDHAAEGLAQEMIRTLKDLSLTTRS